MTNEESARFHGPVISVPPTMLWKQSPVDGVVSCTRLSQSMHAAAAVKICEGGDPASVGYEENPSAGMLLEKFVDIAKSMREHGFVGAPIEAAINAKGQVVVVNGAHRTAVALALGLPAVPTRIVYRAEEWQSLKWLLYSVNSGVCLYQPVPHPDLAWQSWRVDTAVRAEVINEVVRGAASGVEVACHTGGISHGLARLGIRMVGVDTDERVVRVANFLRDVPDVGHTDARFDVCAARPSLPSADFVACLSLLNHHQEVPARWGEGFAIFRECVRAAPLVFLDAPAPGDPVGGSSEFVNADAVFQWCAMSGASGRGELVATRGTRGLQRDILVWRRS